MHYWSLVLLLVVVVVCANTVPAAAFLVVPSTAIAQRTCGTATAIKHTTTPSPRVFSIPYDTRLYAKRRTKESMASKRKRRAQALTKKPQQGDTTPIPPSTLDFKTPAKPLSPTRAVKDKGTEEPVDSKAKQLINAQKESVQMLSHVTNRIQETVPVADELVTTLQQDGYCVVDDFLMDPTLIATLQEESQHLYQDVNNNHMTADVTNLGRGEFIVTIQGGTDQYQHCPRLIELVVTLTAQLSARWNEHANNNTSTTTAALDDRSCMALLRTFDRSSLLASLELLTGTSDNDVPTTLENLVAPPFQTVHDKDPEDKVDDTVDYRQLSLCYFVTEAVCGGGLSFQSDQPDTIRTVEV